MQLGENAHLVKLSLLIYSIEVYHYTLRYIRGLHTFNLRLKTTNMDYSLYMYEKKGEERKKHICFFS